jgi:predicted amidophosphoribosyltransferase
MVCPKCANKLKEGATFCNGCGNKIASTPSKSDIRNFGGYNKLKESGIIAESEER